MYVLSRLLITGEIDKSMPICVIEEIANAHGIFYDYNKIHDERYLQRLIQLINEKEVTRVDKSFNQKDLSKIARFVNAKVKWKLPKLKEAFNFLMSFALLDEQTKALQTEIPENIKDLSFGQQTTENPYSLNACVLYKKCKERQIKLKRELTFDGLKRLYKLSFLSLVELQGLAIKHFFQLKRNDLLELLENSSNEYKESYSTKSLEKEIEKFNERVEKNPRVLITPRTRAEAVYLAAVEFNFDLTTATNPILEYESMKERENYEPLDVLLNANYKRNKRLYNLTYNFNPLLPSCCYRNGLLVSLARREGYKQCDLILLNKYELLQDNYLMYTFHLGWYPEIQNEETIFTNEIVSELEEIICYGSRLEGLIAFSISELKQWFESQMSFKNPLKREETLSQLCLDKLVIILKEIQENEEASRLLDTISFVINYDKENDAQTKAFLNNFKSSSSEVKNQVHDTLQAFFELSMYMRGWDGLESYPLSVALVKNQSQVDINVTRAISKFKEQDAKIDDRKLSVLKLPLYLYKNKSFELSKNKRLATVEKRLKIVERGEGEESCIRISSNYFASTAYKYMVLIGMREPFSIERMRYIS